MAGQAQLPGSDFLEVYASAGPASVHFSVTFLQAVISDMLRREGRWPYNVGPSEGDYQVEADRLGIIYLSNEGLLTGARHKMKNNVGNRCCGEHHCESCQDPCGSG